MAIQAPERTLVPPDRGSLRRHLRFEPEELPRLLGIFAVVGALHVVGFGLFLYYNSQPQYHELTDSKGALVYAGAAALAYGLGLRHAFDADHIAAIDDSTRLMLQKGRKPLGVGLAFSLGHSTIVLVMSVVVAVAATAATRFSSGYADIGGTIGTTVSGLFLYFVGILNLVILVGIVRLWRAMRRGDYEPEHLDRLLMERGLMRRIFRGRFEKGFDSAWQLYPVGLLFGLGFDTASEVALLGLSATAAVGTVGGALPPLAIIALPVIFAAGMSLMDSLDGVFMAKAYDWAFTSPLRKIYYNMTTTWLSVVIALVIGTVQLVSVLADNLGLTDRQPFAFISAIDLGRIGYFIVGAFVLAWAVSIAIWKVRRIEERYDDYAGQLPG